MQQPAERKGKSKDYAKGQSPLNTGVNVGIDVYCCNEATPGGGGNGAVYHTEASYTVPCPVLYRYHYNGALSVQVYLLHPPHGQRCTCGSGFTREESDAVYGTGFAGVRG